MTKDFDDWFRKTIKVPRRNVSLYMKNLLESAFKSGYDSADPVIKRAWRAEYTVGRSKITKPTR